MGRVTPKGGFREGAGRKRLPRRAAKSKTLSVRGNPGEYAAWEGAAKGSENISEWARLALDRAAGYQPPPEHR